jgi:hypothetical protein
MNFTGWRYYTDFYTGENIGIASPDGTQSRLLIDPEVEAWIAAGNTPLPADEGAALWR